MRKEVFNNSIANMISNECRHGIISASKEKYFSLKNIERIMAHPSFSNYNGNFTIERDLIFNDFSVKTLYSYECLLLRMISKTYFIPGIRENSNNRVLKYRGIKD